MKIALLILLLASPSFAQEAQKPADGDAKAIAALQAEYDAASKDEQVALSLLSAARANKAKLEALLEVQRLRLCAKEKIDPDECSWIEGLKGVRKKAGK
jgi:hypothetical protein